MRHLLFTAATLLVLNSCQKKVIEEEVRVAPKPVPVIEEVIVAPVEMGGTQWKYSDQIHDWDFTLSFEEGGKLTTSQTDDSTPEDDTWQQENGVITFTFNEEYAVYTSDQVSDSVISGIAKNAADKAWAWEIVKVKTNN